MKKLFKISLILGLIFSVCVPSFSQGKSNEKAKSKTEQTQEKKDGKGIKIADEAKQKADSKIKENEEDELDSTGQIAKDSTRTFKGKRDKKDSLKEAEGNAYGKNKGDLSGKEFGQLRSEESKNKIATKKSDLNNDIENAEKNLEEMKVKLNEARTRVDSLKKENKISPQEIVQKEDALKLAESKIRELESRIQSKKSSAEE